MWEIITPEKEPVLECKTLKEAYQCKKELIASDQADGNYEKGFYKIVRVK